MLVHLRGVPEAVAARDQITVDVPAPIPAAIVAAVCDAIGHPPLRTTLFHPDGTLRSTTHVLDPSGTLLPPTAPVTGAAVRVMAVLPCDG